MAFETQAQMLAKQRAGQIASRAIKSIETVRKMAEWNVYGVMTISYLHQMMYLVSLFGVLETPTTLEGWVHRISGALGALLIPIAFDIFAIICIKAGTTVGLMRGTRKWGLGLLVVPTAMSGYVNVKSSLDGYGDRGIWIALIYVFVVGLIPVVEFLRSKMNDIDYDAIDAEERRTMASGTAAAEAEAGLMVAPPAREMDRVEALVWTTNGNVKAAMHLYGYESLPKNEKQSFTRKWNNAYARWQKEMADPAAAASETTDAPVSPAVASK